MMIKADDATRCSVSRIMFQSTTKPSTLSWFEIFANACQITSPCGIALASSGKEKMIRGLELKCRPTTQSKRNEAIYGLMGEISESGVNLKLDAWCK